MEEWDAWVVGSYGEYESTGENFKGSTKDRSFLSSKNEYGYVLNVDGHG